MSDATPATLAASSEPLPPREKKKRGGGGGGGGAAAPPVPPSSGAPTPSAPSTAAPAPTAAAPRGRGAKAPAPAVEVRLIMEAPACIESGPFSHKHPTSLPRAGSPRVSRSAACVDRERSDQRRRQPSHGWQGEGRWGRAPCECSRACSRACCCIGRACAIKWPQEGRCFRCCCAARRSTPGPIAATRSACAEA